MSFVHLHLHTEYSLLPHRGAAPPSKGAGADRRCDNRPRSHVRRRRILQGLRRRGHKAHHRLRGLRCATLPLRSGTRRRLGLQPPHTAVQKRDGLQKSVLHRLLLLHRGLLRKAEDRLEAAVGALRGAYLSVRLHCGCNTENAAPWRLRGCKEQGRGAVGTVRQGRLLP